MLSKKKYFAVMGVILLLLAYIITHYPHMLAIAADKEDHSTITTVEANCLLLHNEACDHYSLIKFGHMIENYRMGGYPVFEPFTIIHTIHSDSSYYKGSNFPELGMTNSAVLMVKTLMIDDHYFGELYGVVEWDKTTLVHTITHLVVLKISKNSPVEAIIYEGGESQWATQLHSILVSQ